MGSPGPPLSLGKLALSSWTAADFYLFARTRVCLCSRGRAQIITTSERACSLKCRHPSQPNVRMNFALNVRLIQRAGELLASVSRVRPHEAQSKVKSSLVCLFLRGESDGQVGVGAVTIKRRANELACARNARARARNAPGHRDAATDQIYQKGKLPLRDTIKRTKRRRRKSALKATKRRG